jgi:hypothetical protein
MRQASSQAMPKHTVSLRSMPPTALAWPSAHIRAPANNKSEAAEARTGSGRGIRRIAYEATGELTGITEPSFTTTTLTSPTVERSSIATTTSTGRMRTSIMAASFMACGTPMASPSTTLRRRTAKLAPIPARSAVMIMEASREATPFTGGQDSAGTSTTEVFMMAVSTVAVSMGAVAGKPVIDDHKGTDGWRKPSCAERL